MREALQPLVDAGWLEQQPTSSDEIQGLLGIITRRLDELTGTLKYPDSIYALAYDAVRCGATAVLRAEGVRAKRARHHEMTFEALQRLAIPAVSDRARYYDSCRRKRARLEYDSAGDVSDREAADLVAEARRFARAVRDWLRSAHPALSAETGKTP
jgi:hypothetical protein